MVFCVYSCVCQVAVFALIKLLYCYAKDKYYTGAAFPLDSSLPVLTMSTAQDQDRTVEKKLRQRSGQSLLELPML